MRTIPVIAAVFAVAGTAGSANASLLWDFNFSAPGETASGTLVTDDLSGGSYAITGIGGTFNGVAITGILPAGTLLYGNDNLLFDAPDFLDVFGVAFSLAGGGEELIYGAEGGGGVYFSFDGNGASGVGSFSADLATVPEPTSVGLFATALAGLGLVLRRRRAASQ